MRAFRERQTLRVLRLWRLQVLLQVLKPQQGLMLLLFCGLGFRCCSRSGRLFGGLCFGSGGSGLVLRVEIYFAFGDDAGTHAFGHLRFHHFRCCSGLGLLYLWSGTLLLAVLNQFLGFSAQFLVGTEFVL